jgi:hypothetical protein
MDTEPSSPITEKSLSKEEKLEIDRAKLLSSVLDARLDTLTTKIAWLLNHYPETRDSDITLQLRYWKTFEADKFDGYSITADDLYNLTRLTSIARSRATIQNTHKLYLARDDVRKHRGTLEEDEKTKHRESTVNYPSFFIAADESGKTGTYLITGSLWLLNGIDSRNIFSDLREWRARKKFTDEIHFANISKSNIHNYYDILDILHKRSAAISFKALTLKRSGLSNQSAALEDMFYHMIIRGIEFESNSKRAPLPRTLQLWKDAEEESQDKLFIANITDKLNQAASSIFNNTLYIDEIHAVNSKTTELVQLADLFTASVNRIVNNNGPGDHVKDQFAQEFLKKFGLHKITEKSKSLGDILYIENI